MATKVRENRARRIISRMGSRLEKSPRRDPLAIDFGHWRIVAEGQLRGPFTMTLTEVECWIASSHPKIRSPLDKLISPTDARGSIKMDVLIGDCREVLRQLPANRFACCVTSPPYYFVRDAGHPNQIGKEASVSQYIKNLVEVFRQVRRVLRDDGTLWIVIDDLMCTRRAVRLDGKRSVARDMARGSRSAERWQDAAAAGRTLYSARLAGDGLKDKYMMLIPQRLVLALQLDGWWVRSAIIWAKPSFSPAPVGDRPIHAYEHVLLLSKRAHYYFNATLLRERATTGQRPGRDVWTIRPSTERTSHSAMFPLELAARCVVAGSPVGGCVLDPFAGAGTTGLAAAQHGRCATLIEINRDYAVMAQTRLGLITDRVAPSSG